MLFVKHLEHVFFLDRTYGAGGQRNGCGYTEGIACEAELPKKITHPQDGGNCRWLLFRSSTESHRSFLNVKERVSRSTLFVDVLFVPILRNLAAQTGS